MVQLKQYVVLANSGKALLNGRLPKTEHVFSSRKLKLPGRDQVSSIPTAAVKVQCQYRDQLESGLGVL
jgi:hypothetical protein